MPTRSICPHCRSPIDLLRQEIATSPRATFRICTECDTPIVFSVIPEGSEDTLPVALTGREHQSHTNLAARTHTGD